MYLFFDTETTGFYKPRLVQIAWTKCDDKGKRIDSDDFIIKPKGFKIPKAAANIHGITTEMAIDKGVDILGVLDEFNRMASDAEFIVAHNISFDKRIINAEFYRSKIENVINNKKHLCTMLSSRMYCKIIGNNGIKQPKLSELYSKLFDEELVNAHDASVDVDATEKCFWELRRLGVI